MIVTGAVSVRSFVAGLAAIGSQVPGLAKSAGCDCVVECRYRVTAQRIFEDNYTRCAGRALLGVPCLCRTFPKSRFRIYRIADCVCVPARYLVIGRLSVAQPDKLGTRSSALVITAHLSTCKYPRMSLRGTHPVRISFLCPTMQMCGLVKVMSRGRVHRTRLALAQLLHSLNPNQRLCSAR